MPRPVPSSIRSGLHVLACALALTACGGSKLDARSASATVPPTQSPPAQPPPAQTPPPGQPPAQGGSFAGTYALVDVNGAKPGQTLTLSNPDGKVIGIYSFTAESQLVLDQEASPQGTFFLELVLHDEKGDHSLLDGGTWINSSPPPFDTIGVTFTSAAYGDKFFGAAGDGLVRFSYDLDGDGNADTSLQFQRVDP